MAESEKDPAAVALGTKGGRTRWSAATAEQRKKATEAARLMRTTDLELQAAVDGILQHAVRLTRTQVAALRYVLPAADDADPDGSG